VDAPGGSRRAVTALSYHGGCGELFVQVVDPLDPAALRGAGQGHVVEHRQVLDDLAQAHPPGVRADRHAELGGQQQVGDVLVDPGHAAGVDLHDVDRAGLQ
jgi:hypothetical protein